MIAENAQVENDEFINIFCTPVLDKGETSSHHVDSSNMHTFYQHNPSEHRWTKDHPLEQVIGNPSQSVRARYLWDALEKNMFGSEYGEQDRKAEVLYEYETFKATEGELLLDTYLRYLQVINNLKKYGYLKDNCELNFKFLNNLQPEWKQYATMMRQNKNLLNINIDALYNILKQNQGDVNDAIKSKKKVVVITSDPLALITALLAKAFNRKNFYSKPTNNNLRTSSATSSANKKQEYVKYDYKKQEKKVDEKKRDISKVKCYNCMKEGYFAKDYKKAKVKDYDYYKTKIDSDQEINANMVFTAQMEKVLSDLEESSSSKEETIVEENGVTRPRKYSELTHAEAIQADCDVKAIKIILQGLPPGVYALENGVTRPIKYSELTHAEAIQADCDVKAIKIILQGLPPEVYALDDPWFKDKVLLVQAQANGQILHEEELAFLADPGIIEDPSPSYRPTKVEVPKELPKVSMDVFQRDNSVSNQSAPSFDQYYELNELKAQSQEKDTVIRKLKEINKSLSGNVNEDKVKKDIDEIETINIELDHRVLKLIAKNEHLKQNYKQLHDSIKPTHVRSKEQSLKDELRKLNGKVLVDNVFTTYTIAPEMLKVNLEPIAPKLLNNRIVHSD
nr:hypothetical protein [Tanacetum cinerariifolium]